MVSVFASKIGWQYKSTYPTLALTLILSAIAAAQPPTFELKWGSSGETDGALFFPTDIAVDASGNVYVGDLDRIQKFKP